MPVSNSPEWFHLKFVSSEGMRENEYTGNFLSFKECLCSWLNHFVECMAFKRMLISLKGKICYTFELWRNVKLGCACYRWSWYSAFLLLLNRDGTKTTAFFARYLFTCLQGWSCIRTESKFTLIVCLNILSFWLASSPFLNAEPTLVINLNMMLRYYLGSVVSSNLSLSGAVCSYFQRCVCRNDCHHFFCPLDSCTKI